MKVKEKKIDFSYNLREYWNLIKSRKSLFIGVFLAMLVTELLFVVDKFLFKRIVDDGALFVTGTLGANIFVKTLLIIAGVFISISLIRSAGKWLIVHLIILMDSKIILSLKRKYFNHIVGLSHSFHTTHKSGSLISRMTRGANAVENMSDILIFQFSPMVIQLVAVFISLAYFSLIPAIVILVTTLIFVGYSFFIQQKQQRFKLLYNRAEDAEKGMISDIFTNIDSVKYFGKERLIESKYAKLAEKTKLAGIQEGNWYRWWDSGQIFILSIGTFLLLYFPLKQFLAGDISIGTIVFIYSLYGNVAGPMFGFVWGMRGFYRSMADFQDLFEYGKIENSIKDKPNAKELRVREGNIEFKEVFFKYGKRQIFEGFNLKIKSGEKVALVGHSGCGKTTLIKLINRLYDVDSGEVLIDGKNIKNFKQESVRAETGIVPQECILFDDTIYNNIKFANPKASREKILKAIKFAQLDKIIERFPKKEKTIVGERGVKLSGGEKQRVSIARAILADKKILVLDEATSALDSETEQAIKIALDELLEGRTSILIAHRLSTIMNADRIIVMKNGKIVQQGKHEDLISREGEYKKLWNLQKGGYIR